MDDFIKSIGERKKQEALRGDAGLARRGSPGFVDVKVRFSGFGYMEKGLDAEARLLQWFPRGIRITMVSDLYGGDFDIWVNGRLIHSKMELGHDFLDEATETHRELVRKSVAEAHESANSYPSHRVPFVDIDPASLILPFSPTVASVALRLTNNDDKSSPGLVPDRWDGTVAFKIQCSNDNLVAKYRISKPTGLIRKGRSVTVSLKRRNGCVSNASDRFFVYSLRTQGTKAIEELSWDMPGCMAPVVTPLEISAFQEIETSAGAPPKVKPKARAKPPSKELLEVSAPTNSYVVATEALLPGGISASLPGITDIRPQQPPASKPSSPLLCRSLGA